MFSRDTFFKDRLRQGFSSLLGTTSWNDILPRPAPFPLSCGAAWELSADFRGFIFRFLPFKLDYPHLSTDIEEARPKGRQWVPTWVSILCGSGSGPAAPCTHLGPRLLLRKMRDFLWSPLLPYTYHLQPWSCYYPCYPYHQHTENQKNTDPWPCLQDSHFILSWVVERIEVPLCCVYFSS